MTQLTKTTRYALNNGLRIPINGLGLYKTTPEETLEVVHEALRVGYRHFDTAKMYGNEEEVANALASYVKENPSVKRQDIFYTTKIWNDDHGYDKATRAIEESLEKAKALGYIDLFLIHSPMSNRQLRLETWRALQDAVGSGKVKSIGVSNYGEHHLDELLTWDGLKITPVVNQVELHPWIPRVRLREYLKDKDILLEAYAPITRGKKLGDPNLQKIAQKHGISAAQVLIRWGFHQGFIVLVKTSNLKRIQENFDVLDNVELDEEDMKLLDLPDSHEKTTYWDPTTFEG